jgi:hypothetical protein
MIRNTILSLLSPLLLAGTLHAVPLTLANADFEGGKIAGTNNPVDWTTTENHAGAVYAENIGANGSGSVSLNMQARGDGNILEQSFLASEATADTHGAFYVTMDLGTRANTGLARSIDVEIWNVTDDVSLAKETYDFPTTGTGFIENKTFALNYDNTAPELAGDTIALRITSNGEGNTFATTHWFDNIVVDTEPAADPELRIDPSFSFANDGASETFQLSFSNGGASQDLAVASVTPGGADAAYFTVDSFTDTAIAPGDPGTIDFTFDPSDGVRTYTAEFTIVSNDSGTPTKVVALTVAVADPVLEIDGSFTFENHGTSETFQVAFTNGGATRDLTITAVTPGGTDETFFTVDSFTTPVAAGDSGTIDFTFEPSGDGAYQATFTIESNDPVNPSTVVTIDIEVSDPAISLDVAELDFGTFAPNPGAQTRTVKVSNLGATADLIIDSADFQRGGNGFTATTVPTDPIGPGQSADIVVTFDPGANCGDFGDVLLIESNASNIITLRLPVVAKVTIPGGSTALRIANADFEANTWKSNVGTSPDGWISEPPLSGNGPGNYGQSAPDTPNLASIAAHLQARAGNYYQQDLAANNPGLTASQIDAVTIAFDKCYRNDAYTRSDIFLHVSLHDITNDAEIAGRDVLIRDPGVISGENANQFAPAAIKLAYDSSGFTTEEVAIRIAHVDPPDAKWYATAMIDNVAVSIDGSYVPTNNFDSWAAGYGIPADEADDSDNDTIPALVEYALGLDPTVPDGSPAALDGLLLSFTKGAEAVANGDITYAIETSATMEPGSWTVATPDVNDATTISYTLPAGQEKIFARLVVTRP